MAKDEKKPAPKAADKGKKKKSAKGRWQFYGVSGDKLERKNKYCPKCGPASFLAGHENRLTCGRCKYTEFRKR